MELPDAVLDRVFSILGKEERPGYRPPAEAEAAKKALRAASASLRLVCKRSCGIVDASLTVLETCREDGAPPLPPAAVLASAP